MGTVTVAYREAVGCLLAGLLVACGGREPAPADAERAALSAEVSRARQVLHQEETKQLSATIERSLARGDARGAAVALVALRRLGDFPEATERVVSVSAADPALARDLQESLSILATGERARHHHDALDALRAAETALVWQAQPDVLRSRYQGVGIGLAERLIGEGLARHVSPDPARLAAGGQRHLSRLIAQLGGEFEPTPGSDPAPALREAVAAADRVGLPEPVAVGEWLTAGFRALDPYSVPIWPSQLQQWQG